jgi:hypothetical protein
VTVLGVSWGAGRWGLIALVAVALAIGASVRGKARTVDRVALLVTTVALVITTIGPMHQLIRTSLSFRHQEQHEVAGQAVPEELVVAARRLTHGRTWALVTSAGRCRADAYLYYWLAFRLAPAATDCDHPDLVVSVGVEPPPGHQVLARGHDFVITEG